MSIHAHLSPEAEERLRVQRRNASISSLVISILATLLLGLILAFILLPSLSVEVSTIVTYNAIIEDVESLQKKQINNQIQRKPSAPSSSVAKVIASSTPSPVAIPVPDDAVPAPSTDFGSGNDFGDGWGDGGDGGGGGFGNIPASMRKRCSQQDRLARLATNGGTPQCEDSVLAALRFFKRTQHKNGSWDGGNQVGMTGLVLLAYLGHCETPLSEEFGDNVTSAIAYLVNVNLQNMGKMASSFHSEKWPYEHAIAAYALAESLTFCKQLGINFPNLEKAVADGIQWIINNQHKSGGWDYSYAENSGRGGDLSVTAWQLQALKAGHATRLDFHNYQKCITNGINYVEKCQNSNGGFGYYHTTKAPAGDGPLFTLTGAGTLCVQQHKTAASSSARKGIRYLDQEARFDFSKGANLYEHYYNSQAMINHGGQSWKKYNALFRDQLLNTQNKDGSWPQPADGGHNTESVIYRTALCTLMLEVYYRFLPGTS